MARHGEYKTPGGKLVVADVEVEGGRIAAVEVTGDFFLEPETALADMTAALVGAPADASEALLAALMDASLPEGAELIGFTTAAVATAVRRAIDDDTPRERL
jgi:lipoate-protein ligase A